MQVLEIKENVFWIGTVDWGLRDFHGYSLAREGTTYNAFLVKDEKITLFDTVNARFKDEFLAKINQIVDPAKIDYFIVNHLEPDHSGCLVETMEITRPEKLFVSPMGKDSLLHHYHREDWPVQVVKTGDSLPLGKKTVQFIEMKMLHWPDNMGCYIKEDKLLISSDAFGHNWATSERFDDQVDYSQLKKHLTHYFANIILPYAGNVLKVLEKIKEFGWKIDMIAPDHGLIFRTHVDDVLEAYEEFAQQKAGPKAVIAYDTMWQSTKNMAHSIAQALMESGIAVRLFHLKTCHHSDVMGEVLDAQAVILGSPTHNRGVLPLMADLIQYMKGLRPAGKIGAAFGSYGWDGESVVQIEEAMKSMKMEVIDSLKVKYVPTAEDLNRCAELGRKVSEAIRERKKTTKEASWPEPPH